MKLFFYCIIICITSSSHAVHDGYFGVQEKKKLLPFQSWPCREALQSTGDKTELVPYSLLSLPCLLCIFSKKFFSSYNNNNKKFTLTKFPSTLAHSIRRARWKDHWGKQTYSFHFRCYRPHSARHVQIKYRKRKEKKKKRRRSRQKNEGHRRKGAGGQGKNIKLSGTAEL